MKKNPTNQARKLEIEKAAMSATGIIEQEEWFIKGAEWSDKNPYISSEKQSEQKPVFKMKTPEESLGIDSETYNKIMDECVYGEQETALCDEDELSCFESALFTVFSYAWQSYLLGEEVNVKQWAKEHSKELLEAVKEELKVNNTAWCEEDEKIYQSIMDDTVQENQLNDKQTNWLRDIKYRYFQQPNQEWSEEDEHRIKDTIYFLETAKKHYASTVELDACINWLKSLKPQSEWKPSDEQEPIVPKFKVGDVIRNKWSNHTKKIVRIADDNSFYILDDGIPDCYISAPISDQENWVLVEQNPAWNEEDEEMLKGVIKSCEQCGSEYAYYWLKSLKDRVQPKQEWSEEDEKNLNEVQRILELHGQCSMGLILWLKSIRPQNRWKPSDEQIMYIGEAIDLAEKSEKFSVVSVLKDIREQLKKLREE